MNGKIVIFVAALACQAYAAPSFSFGGLLGGNSGSNLNGGAAGQGSGLFTNMLRPQNGLQLSSSSSFLSALPIKPNEITAQFQGGIKEAMNQAQGFVSQFQNGAKEAMSQFQGLPFQVAGGFGSFDFFRDLAAHYVAQFQSIGADFMNTLIDLQKQAGVILQNFQNFDQKLQELDPDDFLGNLASEIQKFNDNVRKVIDDLQKQLREQIEKIQFAARTTFEKFVEASQEGAHKLQLEIQEAVARIEENIKEIARAGQESFKDFIENLEKIADEFRKNGINLARDISATLQEYINNAIYEGTFDSDALYAFLQELVKGALCDKPEDADLYKQVLAQISGAAHEGADPVIARIRQQIKFVEAQAELFMSQVAKEAQAVIQRPDITLAVQPVQV